MLSARPLDVRRSSSALSLAAALAAACGGGGDTSDDGAAPCPIGDVAAPIELEVVHLDEQSQVKPTTNGTRVPLVAPPQGGWIVLLGVRARNLDGCGLKLTTSFNEACNGPVIKLDSRPARLMDMGDGWGVSTVGTFGNLPICPQVTSARNLHGEAYDVTVAIEDRAGKRAAKTLKLTPYCPSDDRCTCECDRNYVVGGSCPPGGVDAGVVSCP
jgi:hypothetical protein